MKTYEVKDFNLILHSLRRLLCSKFRVIGGANGCYELFSKVGNVMVTMNMGICGRLWNERPHEIVNGLAFSMVNP